MKKLPVLRIALVVISVFFCSSSVCFGKNYNTVKECLDKALKLKESGDVAGAISLVQEAYSDRRLRYGSDKGRRVDKYTKEYLGILIRCLTADEVTYVSIIRYITDSVVSNTRDAFLEIVYELKSGEISSRSASRINEMRQEMSRAIVTHSFCVPPKKYTEVYSITQKALFQYSQAWRKLHLFAFEEKENRQKGNLEADALFNFRKGNELLDQAGIIMVAITEE